MIAVPGIYDISFAEYLADPAPDPSASSSILGTLLDRTPRHAWTAHPRLNPKWEATNQQNYDLGSAAHEMLLGGEERITIIDADSYRTKGAQEARDAAYLVGKTPLLPAQHEEVQAMVAAGRAQIAAHDLRYVFADGYGKAEQTMLWQEGKVWCRARPDWLEHSRACPGLITDYKTCGNAHPDAAARHLYGIGADVQAAFYCRGLRTLTGVERPRFRFVMQETKPPYALSVVELSPGAIDMAERKVETALRLWGWCMAENWWPGYSTKIATIDPPAYAEHAWLERENRAQIHGSERDLLKLAMDWQRPL